jgi:hypothetical protein
MTSIVETLMDTTVTELAADSDLDALVQAYVAGQTDIVALEYFPLVEVFPETETISRITTTHNYRDINLAVRVITKEDSFVEFTNKIASTITAYRTGLRAVQRVLLLMRRNTTLQQLSGSTPYDWVVREVEAVSTTYEALAGDEGIFYVWQVQVLFRIKEQR